MLAMYTQTQNTYYMYVSHTFGKASALPFLSVHFGFEVCYGCAHNKLYTVAICVKYKANFLAELNFVEFSLSR